MSASSEHMNDAIRRGRLRGTAGAAGRSEPAPEPEAEPTPTVPAGPRDSTDTRPARSMNDRIRRHISGQPMTRSEEP